MLNRRKYAYRETSFTAGSARDAVYLGSDCSGSCNSFAAEREPEAPAGHQVGRGFHNSYLASALLFRNLYFGSRIRIFPARIQASKVRIDKKFKYFVDPKIFTKHSEIWFGMFWTTNPNPRDQLVTYRYPAGSGIHKRFVYVLLEHVKSSLIHCSQ